MTKSGGICGIMTRDTDHMVRVRQDKLQALGESALGADDLLHLLQRLRRSRAAGKQLVPACMPPRQHVRYAQAC